MSSNPSLAAALGEENEFTSFTVVPDSYYPVTVGVAEIGATASKVESVAPGFPPVEQGFLPWVKLNLEISEGPFAGEVVSRNYFINAGSAKSTKGGKIPLLSAACRAISGMGVDDTVLKQYGIGWDPQKPGETDKDFTARARHAFVMGFLALDVAQRTDLMTKFLRVPAWDGKKAIVHLEVSVYDRKNDDGTPKTDDFGNVMKGASNEIAGFYPMTGHEKVNIAFVRRFAFPKQEAELKAGQEVGG